MVDFSNGTWRSLVDGTEYSVIPDSGVYPPQPLQETTYAPYENLQPDPSVSNPVLSASDVTDQTATFVADPFIYVPDGSDGFTDWHMFFETQRSNYAVIGHATSSDDGVTWSYDTTVLDAGSHLSYPQVFRNNGEYYMVPNRGQNDYQPLYRATTFPTSWTEERQWLSSVTHDFKDHMLYWHNDRWWYIVATNDGATNGGIRVYYSDSGISDIGNVTSWTAHPNNPVVSGRPSAARGAGRGLIENDGDIIAFYQDTVQEYGDKVRAYRIDTLTTSGYSDTELAESPILEESGSGWDSDRKHHYDPWYVAANDYWRGAVDGYDGSAWHIGIYRAEPASSDFTNRWYFDEGSGTSVNDDVGALDFTLNNPTWVSGDGKGGYVLSANGADTYGYTSENLTSTDSYTAGIWFNADGTSSQQHVFQANDHSEFGAAQWSIDIGVSASGEVRVFVKQATDIELTTAINSGEWYFVGLIADANNNVTAYIGQPGDTDLTQFGQTSYGTADNPATEFNVAANLYGGTGTRNRHFGGDFDDPIYSEAALSLSTLESHFDATKGNYPTSGGGGGGTTVVSDDFETGSLDTGEWSGDTGAATVQNGTVISGSYSLQLDAGPNELLNAFSTAGQVDTAQWKWQVTNATEATYFRLYNSGSRNVNIRITSGELQWYDGSTYTTIQTGMSAGTTYDMELTNFDYSNNQCECYVDGSLAGTVGFEASVSQHDEMSFRMGNGTHTAYIDDVEVTQ